MIIFLNGSSSAGKTTLARELQALCSTPLLYLGIDTFCNMLPAQYLWYAEKADEGFKINNDGHSITITCGSVGKALYKSIPDVLLAFTLHGQSIVLDEVVLSTHDLEFYAEKLNSQTVYFIKVDAPLNVKEEREQNRGNRTIGMARSQDTMVHAHNFEYDFSVDTHSLSTTIAAKQILNFVSQTPDPQAFKKILEKISA